jgi:TRAP-type C4-dicarboxylate transport system permease small subunit
MTYSIIKKLSNSLKTFQEIILILTSSFITIIIASGAILRYFFNKDLYGAEEFTSIAAFWMYFIGAIYATHKKKHITVEMFSSICKNVATIRIIKLISLAATILVSLLYSWWGLEFFYWSFTKGGKSVAWRVPLVYGHSAVSIAFILMTFYFTINFKNEITNFNQGLEKC